MCCKYSFQFGICLFYGILSVIWKLYIYVNKCINIFLWLLGFRSCFERHSSVQKYKCLLMLCSLILWLYILYLSICSFEIYSDF